MGTAFSTHGRNDNAYRVRVKTCERKTFGGPVYLFFGLFNDAFALTQTI